jgi:hypothetical protein
MRSDRLTWPHRASLTSGSITYGKYKIHLRGVGQGEFFPAFTAQPTGLKSVFT